MQISLEDIPSDFATAWGITEAAAQVLLSIVVMLAVLLPVMFLARGNRGFSIEIVMMFLVMSFLVGIGWLPFWILIASVGVISIAIAFLGANVVVGGE